MAGAHAVHAADRPRRQGDLPRNEPARTPGRPPGNRRLCGPHIRRSPGRLSDVRQDSSRGEPAGVGVGNSWCVVTHPYSTELGTLVGGAPGMATSNRGGPHRRLADSDSSPIWLAAMRGDVEEIRQLTASGADLDAAGNRAAGTAVED